MKKEIRDRINKNRDDESDLNSILRSLPIQPMQKWKQGTRFDGEPKTNSKRTQAVLRKALYNSLLNPLSTYSEEIVNNLRGEVSPELFSELEKSAKKKFESRSPAHPYIPIDEREPEPIKEPKPKNRGQFQKAPIFKLLGISFEDPSFTRLIRKEKADRTKREKTLRLRGKI